MMIIVTALAVGLAPSGAWAKKVTIKENIGFGQLQADCAAAGGDFTEGDVGGLHAFACNMDCQGTGNNNIDTDHCNVNCVENETPGNCQGWTPDRIAPPKAADLKSFFKAASTKKKAN